jgi:hypothetical protein
MYHSRRTRGLFPLFCVAAVLMVGGVARATITVHDLSQNPSTGVFTYTVQLDNAAKVQSNDGFVIYDFPGLVNYSLSGGLSSSQFSLTQTLTSNTLNATSSVDAFGLTAAVSNGLPFDNPATDNLSYEYVGPPIPMLGPVTATLTLTSSVLGGVGNSVYASVDHSGPNATVPYSFAANPVSVPTSVPEPASSFGVAALAILWAGRRNRRAA